MKQPTPCASDFLVTKEYVKTVVDNHLTGSNMRRYRESKGVSLRAVARRLGKSAPYVSDLELGRRAWDLARVLKHMYAIEECHQLTAKGRET